jgi:hypothetical protein
MDYSREIMHELGRTEELLLKGLKEVNDKGELTNQSLEVLDSVLDNILDTYKLLGSGEKMIEEHGYPERPYPYMMYADGRRGRDGDNDGRYYEGRYMYDDGMRGNSYGEQSYRGRYSGNDEYMNELHRKMESAKTEQERELIRGMIRDHENGR